MNSKAQFLQVLLVIVTMTFAVRASNNMVSTTVPLLARYYFHFTQTEIGLISAVFSLGTFVTSGLLNSKLPSPTRRKVFIASSIAYAVVLPLYYLVGPLTLWLLTGVAGLTLGSVMPNIITSAGLLEDRRARERVLSIYTLALSASLVAGPAIETAILSSFSLPYVFLFFTPLGAVAAILSFLIKFPEEKTGSTMKVKVIGNPGFTTAVINILAYNIPFAVILAFGGIYAVSEFHVSFAEVTGLFTLFFATSLLSRIYLSIRPADSVRLHAMTAMSLTVIGLLLILFGINVYSFAIALLILGFPHGLTYPLSIISISRTFSPAERNAANSVFFATMMLVGVVTPSIAGALAQEIGLKDLFGVLIPVVLVLLVMLNKYVRVVDNVVKEEIKARA